MVAVESCGSVDGWLQGLHGGCGVRENDDSRLYWEWLEWAANGEGSIR